MSMKRAKENRRGKEGDGAGGFWEKKAPDEAKGPSWATDVASQPDESFVQYAPTSSFAVNALISHPKFGKGLVTEVDGTKIAVLFETEIKRLSHDPAGPRPAPAPASA